MPTIGLPAALAIAGGSLLGGVGGGLGSYMSGKAEENAAAAKARADMKITKENALGPVRGGSERAFEMGGLGPTGSMERLGALTLAGAPNTSGVGGLTLPPVAGAAGDINLEQLFSPKKFGAGYSVGRKF